MFTSPSMVIVKKPLIFINQYLAGSFRISVSLRICRRGRVSCLCRMKWETELCMIITGEQGNHAVWHRYWRRMGKRL